MRVFPGGESLRAMQARMVDALDAVVAAHPNETVVVVSHADPIKSAIAHYTGMHLDLFQRLHVSPASVTVFDFHAYGATAREVQRHRRPRRPRPRTEAGRSERDVMTDAIEFDPVDAIGAGAFGEPGARTFVIQARKGGAVLSVLVEKEQVALLATEAEQFLDRIAEEHPEEPVTIVRAGQRWRGRRTSRSSGPG